MASGQQARQRNKQKLLKRRRQRDRHRGEFAPRATLSRKMADQLGDAYDLIGRGDFGAAEQLLRALDARATNCPEIVEALYFLYQATRDHEKSCIAAERLARLLPDDPEAPLIYAQESMQCGRAVVALLNYQKFIEQWPEHPHVSKAKYAIELLVPEVERRIKESGFPKERGLVLCALHEESMCLLHNGQFSACAKKCRELLAQAPTFVSARNNLAIACFQSGLAAEAVAVVEETRRQFPDNRFAEAALAKIYFLTGRAAEARELADQIVAKPPTSQDALLSALELLAFLGRDEEIVTLAEAATEAQVADEDRRAFLQHFLAYAKCRLGDRKGAQARWKKCLKQSTRHSEVEANLLDLKSGEGHAPWALSLGNWIPRQVFADVAREMRDREDSRLSLYPGLASLIPALLDRGDPPGRELALRLAIADGSPPMLDALTSFAFGTRGPDAMRFEALQFLKQAGTIDAGPHRIYARGSWQDIELFAAEITGEATNLCSSPRVRELVTNGIEAMRAGDYERSEASFQAALEVDPDDCTAVYNLCTTWMRRGGRAGERKARARMEQLHRDFPDYPFAAIAMAQFAAIKGDFQQARDLLAPIFHAKRLHLSEATALFTCQIQIALEEGNVDVAKRTFEMLREIAGEDDEMVRTLRDKIDAASRRGGLRSLFSKVL